MNKSKFLIGSLLAAGFTGETAAIAQSAPGDDGADAQPRNAVFQTFKLDHAYILAGHSSHRSHSSHSSHRSGSGGGYSSYPVYTPTPAPSPSPRYYPSPSPSPVPLYSAPTVTRPVDESPQPLSGRTELFTTIVKRVQLGLLAYGYYSGAIDGTVGPTMRTSLMRMQTDFKLSPTGTITAEVLDALRITAR